MHLVLYAKPRCSLCDRAREAVEDVLDDLHGRIEATFEEVDVRADEALYARYRHDVPVLAIDGREAFKHRVDEARLAARLVDGLPAPLEEGADP
jgi:glutaredoxin